MAELLWTVEFTGQAKKPHQNLSPMALEAFWRLTKDLKKGPIASGWKNYSQIHTQSSLPSKKRKTHLRGFLESR